jgi:hypothetical protein
MQPYQEASQEIKRQGELPFTILKKAGNIATSAALGGAALSGGSSILKKALPFLNKYIPENLAIKGLSKINPAFGKFINKAKEGGKSFDEIKEFITEQLGEAKQETENENQPEKDNRNIIEQYSPELHGYILDQIKKGMSPLQAADSSNFLQKHKDIIKKITKDHKAPWSSIVESTYGQAGKAPIQEEQMQQQPQQMQQQPQQIQQQVQKQGNQNPQLKDPLFRALIAGDVQDVMQHAGVNEKQAISLVQRFNQNSPQQMQQQPQGQPQGQGLDPKLAQIIGGISQGIQKLRGSRG